MTVQQAEQAAGEMYEAWLRHNPKAVTRLSKKAVDELKMFAGYLIWKHANYPEVAAGKEPR